MKYLIHDPLLDSVERNHLAWLDTTGTPPADNRGTLYRYATKTHPTSGEVAMCIPDAEADPEAGIFSQEEIDLMVDALDETWEPEDEA